MPSDELGQYKQLIVNQLSDILIVEEPQLFCCIFQIPGIIQSKEER